MRAKDASSEDSSPLEFTELDESFKFLQTADDPLPFASPLELRQQNKNKGNARSFRKSESEADHSLPFFRFRCSVSLPAVFEPVADLSRGESRSLSQISFLPGRRVRVRLIPFSQSVAGLFLEAVRCLFSVPNGSRQRVFPADPVLAHCSQWPASDLLGFDVMSFEPEVLQLLVRRGAEVVALQNAIQLFELTSVHEQDTELSSGSDGWDKTYRWKWTRAFALRTDSFLCRISQEGSDQRNLARRSMLPDCCNTSQTQATCSCVKPKDWKGMRDEATGAGQASMAEDRDDEWPLMPARDVRGMWDDSLMCPIIMSQKEVVRIEGIAMRGWGRVREKRGAARRGKSSAHHVFQTATDDRCFAPTFLPSRRAAQAEISDRREDHVVTDRRDQNLAADQVLRQFERESQAQRLCNRSRAAMIGSACE